MSPTTQTIIGVVAIAGIAVGLYLVWRRKREPFKVLGQLSPYKSVYYQCLSECERGDPAKQLTPTKGNMMCREYCDSSLTELSRRGGPSYEDIPSVKLPPYKSVIDEAYEVCGDGSQNSWCRSIYTTSSEIDEKCRQDCEYSAYPVDTCMDLCRKSKFGNYAMGWSWK
jgi:hypothetical protein